jgi:hypothetical protein
MNEMGTCVICNRATEHMACGQCERRINQQLSEIQEFAIYAQSNLIPGQGAGGRGTERPLGIRIDALDLVAGFDVLPALESWERAFRQDYGLTPYGQASLERNRAAGEHNLAQVTLTGVIRFLHAWTAKVCHEHPAVDEYAKEVAALWRQAQAASGQSPRTSWSVDCPADVDGGECGNRLRVNGQDFDGYVGCRSCGTRWEVKRLLLVVASSQTAEIWLDVDAAVQMFSVSPRTLRDWAKRGHIRRKGGKFEVASLTAHLRGVSA